METHPSYGLGFSFAIVVFCLGLYLIHTVVKEKQGKANSKSVPISVGKYIFIDFAISIIIGLIMAFALQMPTYESSSTTKHKCVICGKTEGTKQINNNKIGGKWDEEWYCTKHYADAWQYYYGNNN